MQLPKASIIITLLTLVSGIAAQNIFDERDVDDVRLDARDLYIRDLESELAARDANEAQMKYLEQRDVLIKRNCVSTICDPSGSGHRDCHSFGCNAGCAANGFCRPPVPAFKGKKGGR